MRRNKDSLKAKSLLLISMYLLLSSLPVEGGITGESGTLFNMTASAGHISTADGNSLYSWGYSLVGNVMQYPGPTLILNQGDTVTVTLTNNLPASAGNVSIVFPGHAVTATGGVAGAITQEAPPDGVTDVTYTFTAANAGTYLYNSGTRPEIQVEMGLVGAIIVRPYGYNPASPQAYSHSDAAYDYEYLFLLTEMDPKIHELLDQQGIDALANYDYLSDYFPAYWFINGRTAMDTMIMNAPWLPNQPYDCMPRMHPGDKLLMRVVSAGRDLHPFHQHGNHAKEIARDGRMLGSSGTSGADIGPSVFTVTSVPGETVDAIFEWTGKGMGWDIYGTGAEYEHSCVDGDLDGFDDTTMEYCADHGKAFPITLPETQELTLGAFYSGTPFLGTLGALPPGEGGMNPNAGFAFMWHSHAEKEMTNWDIFPGGMMTILIIEPPGVMIE
jgi:hypothetical protein